MAGSQSPRIGAIIRMRVSLVNINLGDIMSQSPRIGAIIRIYYKEAVMKGGTMSLNPLESGQSFE